MPVELTRRYPVIILRVGYTSEPFARWHGISSMNNLGVLAAVVAYGWVIAGKLAA